MTKKGLGELNCDEEASLSSSKTLLVSDGSEVILINKEFFKKHISLEFKNYLREKVTQSNKFLELRIYMNRKNIL